MRTAAALLAAACLAACTTERPPTSGRRLTAHVEVAVYQNVASSPPVAGAKVAFVDPDGGGTVVVTGADGIARAEMTPGGSVTALVPLVPADNPPYLSTVLDVQDGDRIALGMPPGDAIPPAPGGTPACAQATLKATYTGGDVAGLAGVYLRRTTDADQIDGSVAGPLDPSATITITGAGATRAFVKTDVVGPAPGDQQWIREAIDGCATSYAIDLGLDLLPWVGVPTLDVAQGVIHVPIDGTGGGDLLDAKISYTHAGSYVSWEIAGPHAGDLLLPTLPDDLAGLMPVAGDTLHSAAAWLIDDDAIHGYDEARTRAAALAAAANDFTGSSVERVRTSYRIALF